MSSSMRTSATITGDNTAVNEARRTHTTQQCTRRADTFGCMCVAFSKADDVTCPTGVVGQLQPRQPHGHIHVGGLWRRFRGRFHTNSKTKAQAEAQAAAATGAARWPRRRAGATTSCDQPAEGSNVGRTAPQRLGTHPDNHPETEGPRQHARVSCLVLLTTAGGGYEGACATVAL